MSKVSVIIPAHNAENYMEKCLASLGNQTFKDWEAIVVDDASMDGTGIIAEKHARVIKLEQNLGEGGARNKGARAAKGEVLAFTDADVVLPADWLEKILKNLENHDVKCVGGGYCGTLGDSFIEKFAFLELSFRRKDLPQFVNTIVSNNFACYRDVFFESGGFPEKYKGEDLRLSYRISKKYKILWDKGNGVYHHFRSDVTGYLRQQYYFARDTVLIYYEYPELFFVKTHQGRSLYLETVMMFLGILSIYVYPLSFPLFLTAIMAINIPFLTYLKSNGISLIKSIYIIYMRDFVCVLGILSGVLLCLRELTVSIVKRLQLASSDIS